MHLVESSGNRTITPLTKTNAHRVKSIRQIGTNRDAVTFHFRKKHTGMHMYIHTYTENGEERELHPADFKNWEAVEFKYPGYLEELEKIATDAYRWNSHNPEARAETDIMGYEKQLHEDLKKIPEAKRLDYINTYKSKISVLFHSLSRCANPMVTGRGGFNFQRNEKAQNAYRNRYDEFLQWREKFLKAMQQLMERNRPEEEKREETWHRLKREIASSADTIHEIDTGKARGYNRALFVSSIFNKVSTFAGHGEVEIVQRAIDFISEYNAGVKKPVITPRHRFFQLPEAARRMREKLKVTREQENREVTFEGGTLVWNYQESRLQILFNKIPEESKRRELKSSGFHWSPKNRAWQRQLNPNTVSAAKRILNLQNI
nr:hypothetical protein [Bacteroides ovatus]